MYNEIIVDHFMNPQFSGQLESPDLVLKIGNPVCGDRIQVDIKLQADRITEVAFQAWGCATSVATADIFCQSLNNKTLDSFVAAPESEIALLLGDLEPSQRHCLDILLGLFAQLKCNIKAAEEMEVS